MDNPFRPTFLEGYDVFHELETWAQQARSGSSERHWTIGRYVLGSGRPGYRCELAWNLNGQCVSLHHYALSPEQAVHDVFGEFRRTQEGK